MDTQPVPNLAEVLAQVPDPRMARGQRHPWTALLLLIGVALLSGANTQQACARWDQHARWTWLQRLGFTRRGGPSGTTAHRVLHQVSVADLETCLGQWFGQVRAAWPHGACRWLDGIAIDARRCAERADWGRRMCIC